MRFDVILTLYDDVTTWHVCLSAGHLSMDGGGGTILPPAEGHSQTPSQGQDNNVATFSVPPPSQSHLHAQETGVEETPALELELKNVE